MSRQNTLSDAADQFQIRPDITFLNHRSFGACPRQVFEVYQHWQRRLEADPVEFLGRRLPGLLNEAREPLAAYVGTQADQIVFVTSPTALIFPLAKICQRARAAGMITVVE